MSLSTSGPRTHPPIARSTTVWPRAQRRTKSCTECQRRKQKCNKLQPCSHCKRRFPEPVCEYGPLKRTSLPQVISSSLQQRPLFLFPVSRPTSKPRAFHFRQQARPLSPSLAALQLHPRPLLPRQPAPSRPQKRPIIAPWSDLSLVTEYPRIAEDSDPDDADAGGSPSTDAGDAGTAARWAPDTDASPQRHVDAQPVEGATLLAVVRQATPGRHPPRRGSPRRHGACVPNPWLLAGPLDAMNGLPIPVTKQNAMLIHTFGEVLYHLKGSFDGIPDHDNPFLEHYVPWCVQSPLLVQTSLYISAQPLAERHFLDETTAMSIKVNAIHVLNEYLRTAACTDDEAMGAVTQFISMEFFYGTADSMQAHLKGLRQMILMRGGFSHSLVGALVTKTALVGDCIVAAALEEEPILQETPTFDCIFDERPPATFNISHSSPLLAPRLPFGFCISSLGLHPATAWILDELGFLINVVLSLPPRPTETELETLRSTAAWILDRITQLPVNSPDAAVTVTDATPHLSLADSAKRQSREAVSRATVAGASVPETQVSGEEAASRQPAGLSAPDDDPPKPHSLLPRYPRFSSRSPSPPASAEGGSADAGPAVASDRDHFQHQRQPFLHHSNPPPPAGPLYTAVRLAAPLYSRAILERRPFSEVCSDADALAILAASWRVPLDRWRGVVGVFIFVMLAIVPTLHQRSDRTDDEEGNGGSGGGIRSHIHTRFTKSILQIGLMNMSLVDWPACREIMSRALRLQRWLRVGPGDGGAVEEVS